MVLRRGDTGLRSQVFAVLDGGGVAIFPCDTIYGFVGTVPATESRIRQIKGRGETNPFLMLVGTADQAVELSNGPLDERVVSLWPGPLTVVMRAAEGTVAVRLPDDPFLIEMIRSLGSPVYSTSVNRSGFPPMWRIRDIVAEFENEVDLIVDAGDYPEGAPSTILDITQRPYRILRQGAFEVPAALLER